MTDHNPYAPPKGEVRDPAPAFGGELASRWSRLGASIVDTIVILLMTVPPLFFANYFEQVMAGTQSFLVQLSASAFSFALFAAANSYLMTTAGQTIGKKILGIRVVDAATAQLPPLGRQLGLRYGTMWFISLVPLVGTVVGLVDVLMIFRGDKRCIHDHLAGTKVVTA